MKNTFPLIPSHISYIPPNLVYLGLGLSELVPDLQTYEGVYSAWSNNTLNGQSEWSIPQFRGQFADFHFAIEFGTHSWNRWAEKYFGLPHIPDGYVWAGRSPKYYVNNLNPFRGAYLSQNSRGTTSWEFLNHNKLYGGDADKKHYLIKRNDPEYKKIAKYFTTPKWERKPLSEPVEDSPETKLVKEYQKAHKELNEAKEKNYTITYDGHSDRIIQKEESIVIWNNNVCLLPTSGLPVLWLHYKIIKRDPTPNFEVYGPNSGVKVKPYLTKFGWSFSPTPLGVIHIKREIFTKLHNELTELTPDVDSVTIQGITFTVNQISELVRFRDKYVPNL